MKANEDWCTALRVIAMLMVLALHASGLWLVGNVTSPDWRIANAVNSACRPAAPFFFMLAGYLLSRGRATPLFTYAGKRLRRIVPSFLAVTAFALAYRSVVANEQLGISAAWQWLAVPQFYHLWFFYALVLAYAGLWIMRNVPVDIAPATGALVCFALICVPGWREESLLPFVFYALAGHFVGTTPAARWLPVLAAMAAAAMLSWVYMATAGASADIGHLDQQWYRYTSLSVVGASFLLFYALRHLLATVRVPRLVDHASAASLFVYCWHPFIIDGVNRLFPTMADRLGAAVGIAVVVTACATLLTAAHFAWQAAGMRRAAVGETSKMTAITRRPP